MKILIWNYRKLANTGGPEGYLFNIREYLKSHPNDSVVFYSDLIKSEKPTLRPSGKKMNFFGRMVNDMKQIINLCWRYYHLPVPEIPNNFDINEFDYVHIHKIVDFYSFKNQFKNYRGKTILTTHCPCPWTDEMLSHFDSFVHLFRPIILNWECKAYKMVDYLMFPCKGAREPYEKEFKIKKVFTQNEYKFFYVPSAIMDLKVDTKRMQKLSDIGIPNGSFVLSYFGRHTSIKGYDILKEVGAKLLDKYPNFYILCAGRGDIEPYRHKRWIELGFINNVHELLYQTDLYISANRETYFDLVVLEILRSSTKMIMSSTGGNNHFKEHDKKEREGLDFFDINKEDELIDLVENAIKQKIADPESYKKSCEANRNLFLNYYTMDSFIPNYIKAIYKLNI